MDPSFGRVLTDMLRHLHEVAKVSPPPVAEKDLWPPQRAVQAKERAKSGVRENTRLHADTCTSVTRLE